MSDHTSTVSDDELLRRPIIIVGAPRSGTSMLGRILRRHRDVALVGEPRMVWRYGNDGKSDMLRRADARPEVIAHIRRFFADAVRKAGRTRLIEKTPSNSLRPEFVEAVFPDCQFVHILRHGNNSVLAIAEFWKNHAHGVRNVTGPNLLRRRIRELGWRRLPRYAMEFLRRLAPASLRKVAGPGLWGPRLPGLQQMAREMTPLELGCLQWRMCVEIMCHFGRQLPADRYMECRLEDMGEELIRRILRFGDLPDDPAVFDYLHSTYDPKRPGARMKQCDPKDLQTIERWIEPTLTWLKLD